MFLFQFILILVVITQSANGDQKCVYYPTDGICSNYVNGEVYIGESDSMPNIENSLATLKPLLGIASPVYPACADSYAKWICSLAYPPCDNTNVPILPCKSTCQDIANNNCSLAFHDNILESIYPSQDYYPIPTNDICDQYIDSFYFGKGFILPTSSIYNVPYPTDQCNNIQNSFQQKCFSPLIPKPQHLLDNDTYCEGGCCWPCPQSYSLYPSGILDKGFLVTQLLRIFSALTSLVMLLSYILLPGKKTHANVLTMFTSLAIFLYSSNVFFSLSDARRIQCADLVNPSTQKNNPLCAVQGAWLIFAGHATTTWLSAIILNLHTHTVWNSNIMFTKYLYVHLVCWGVPAIITIIALSLGVINYQFGTLCFIDLEHVGTLFFYPLSIWIVPSVFIHFATFFHIARIATQTHVQSIETNNTGETSIMNHRSHVIQAFRIQWRALLLAIILLATVLLYWLFYVQTINQILDTTNNRDSLGDWKKCVGLGFGQDFCTRYSVKFVPHLSILFTAEVLVSFIGIWLLIIFTNSNLRREWGYWLSERFKPRQKKLEVPDQFFSI